MATRCKPGDIAVILYDEPECLGNVGRLVRVHPTLALNKSLNLDCWLIDPLTTDPWFVAEANGTITFQSIGPNSNVEHPDAWMLPIKDVLPGKQDLKELSLTEPGSEPSYLISDEECRAYERVQARIDEELLKDGSVNINGCAAFVANITAPHTMNAGSMCPVTADISGRVPNIGRGFFNCSAQMLEGSTFKPHVLGGSNECC